MAKSIIINLLLTFMLGYFTSCSKSETVNQNEDPITTFNNGEPFKGGDYYVAPSGDDSNPGTFESPWATWQKAFDTAEPGDTVYFRGGVYMPNASAHGNNITMIAPHEIKPIGKNGKPGNPICYFSYPGETPILDCSLITPDGNFNTGLNMIRANFIRFRGLTLRNVKQTKDYVECFGIGASDCSNLTFDNITIHDIGGNAFRFFGALGYYPDEATYDSTYFINCDAYNCCDNLPRTTGGHPALGGAADGYKTFNEPGAYLHFEGCRAWNCSDDGFDPGGSVVTVIKNCWSFNNGYLEGDGTGYKTGGIMPNVTGITRVIINCISAFNKSYGFFLLEYPEYFRTNARFYNNISYGNQFGFVFSNNAMYPNVLGVWRNNISYKNKELPFSNSYQVYAESHNTWDLIAGYPGCEDSKETSVTDADFVSLIPNELKGPRKADGSLPDLDFLKLTNSSKLKGAGTFVGMSANPDIGIDWDYLKKK